MIYLDNAATSFQKPREVYRSVQWAMKNLGSPGRGGHRYAMAAAETAFSCREKAARLFHMENPENVVFTFNATHGLNIAISSIVKRGMRVVVTGYEHNSVTRPLKAAGAELDVVATELFEPEMAMSVFEQKLRRNPDAVVMNHVSNAFGYEWPVERAAALCRMRNIPFILDASQSAGVLDVDMGKLGAAFIAMPGHKGLYGPQGTGLLLCAADAQPLISGGSGSDSLSQVMPQFLPDRLEAGTHNMPGIAGLSAGLDHVLKRGTAEILEHEKTLCAIAADGLRHTRGVRTYSSEHMFAQTGVLSFEIVGMSPEEAGEKLAGQNIAVRAGLHCAPLAHKTAGTLPSGTIRASFSDFTKRSDVYALVDAVRRISKK